ncbi:MAG: hypothetical protein ABF335_04380 [Alphaproteobacteria bacterium]
MLHRIDRVQLATATPQEAAQPWQRYLGAQPDGTQDCTALNARIHRYRLAQGFVEFVEPLGAGPVSDALSKRGGPHLFAGGATTKDMTALKTHLHSQSIAFTEESGQLHLDMNSDIAGLRMVVSKDEDRASVGMIDFLYEVTLLHADAEGATKRFCEIFGLNAGHFSPITSDKFGYYGILTLFDPDDLHRFEVITATAADKTMGRFFERTGPCLYMSFGESARMAEIEQLVSADNQGHTIDRPADRDPSLTPDQMWLHPPTLNGMMLGISRPSMAWTWSGRPDRVEAL